MFHELLCGSTRVSKDDFAVDFGGIADDVVEMLNSPQAQRTIQEARETMERGSLRKVDFGEFNNGERIRGGRSRCDRRNFRTANAEVFNRTSYLCWHWESLTLSTDARLSTLLVKQGFSF